MQMILQDGLLGHNIQKIRKSKRLTQKVVVREMVDMGSTLSVTHYGHIEQGRKNISVTDLIRLKRIFHVEYDAFFEGLLPE